MDGLSASVDRVSRESGSVWDPDGGIDDSVIANRSDGARPLATHPFEALTP